MIIDGIKCKKIFPVTEKEKQKDFYAAIPLSVLEKLGEGSNKTKMLMLLYCYGRMNTGRWFSLSGEILKQYGLTKRQKNKVLITFEEVGLLELQKQRGKSTKIKLTFM